MTHDPGRIEQRDDDPIAELADRAPNGADPDPLGEIAEILARGVRRCLGRALPGETIRLYRTDEEDP
jgi:hypothetical protein